jgi:hypothetical protein
MKTAPTHKRVISQPLVNLSVGEKKQNKETTKFAKCIKICTLV